jgi:hypothetical protein
MWPVREPVRLLCGLPRLAALGVIEPGLLRPFYLDFEENDA